MDFNAIFGRKGGLSETPAGNITGYHGTVRELSKPTATIGSHTKSLNFGPGFYFATEEADAAVFGSIVYRAELSVQTPLNVYRSNSSREDPVMKRIQKAMGLSDEDAYSFEEESRHPMRILMEKAELMIDVDLLTAASVQRFLKKIGYDGIIVDRDIVNYEWRNSGMSPILGGPATPPTKMKGDFVVVFDASQILSWEKFGDAWERDVAKFR